MKALLIGAAMIGAFGGQLAAQASSPGNVVVPSAGGAVVVPWIWNLSWWGDPSCGRPHGDNGFPSWGYACDPLYAGNYGYSYPVASLTIALPQVEAPQPPAPPPPPPRARLVVNEYHWPPSGDKPSAATYSIVSKDGRVESATAVWVQGDALCYVKPGGGQGRTPIVSIDRQHTRQRNAEKQLEFSLPGED
jgi:hypothetical protein